jgi:hypothetical protein
MHRLAALLCVVLIVVVGCGESDSESDRPTTSASVAFDRALHDELMTMFEEDQAGRLSGDWDSVDDRARTERLKGIIAEHGWPTFDLVGEDGADAAWLIAQHSDLDPEFQQEALNLIKKAAADGQASKGNVAYLEDRVAAGAGAPQTYGTQIGCVRGQAKPAPLKDPERVDELRADAGLEPFGRLPGRGGRDVRRREDRPVTGQTSCAPVDSSARRRPDAEMRHCR